MCRQRTGDHRKHGLCSDPVNAARCDPRQSRLPTSLRHFDIVEAIPGARASLRWCGWRGIALLLVPAVVIVALVVVGVAQAVGVAFACLLGLFGIAALAAVGFVMMRALASLCCVTELAHVLCERDDGPVFVKDSGHRYRFANDAAAELVGRKPLDILGRRDTELDLGATALAFEENDRVCLDRDLPTLFRESQKKAEGEQAFLVAKYPLHDCRGRITGLVAMARDITDELELRKLSRRRTDETRAWFDRNPLPVVAFASSDLRIINANTAALQCYGYSRDALLQMHLPELFAPDEARRLRSYLRGHRHGAPTGSVGWKHSKASGESFDVLVDIGNLPHEEVPMRLMLVRDVSGEAAARAALEACSARYEDLVESGLSLVWTHDMDGRLLRVNGAMAEALGYERGDMAGRALSEFVAEGTAEHWRDYVDRFHSLKRDAGLLHFSSRSGERRVWQYQFVCYPDAKPAPYVLAAAQDVTVRHRHELRMRDQNRRDPLTGCRVRQFVDAFSQQMAVDQAWGCVVVDIDYFRQLNASEGRGRGDEVLRDLVQLLLNNARAGDEVVRMGGDQFAVLMPQATADAARELSDRLGSASRDGMPAVFSLGWAVREAGESLESTLRRADKMLLRSRADTRG